MSNSFSWGQRLALINAYTPSDGVACTALGVSIDELETARGLQQCGTISLDDSVVATNKNIFEGVKATASLTRISAPVRTPVSDSIQPVKKIPSVTGAPPATSNKPERAPKKRGRTGSKIARAFAAIPSEPTDADKFATANGVSLAVLRQSKRFDKNGSGLVRVRKDREAGVLMVWREQETLPPAA